MANSRTGILLGTLCVALAASVAAAQVPDLGIEAGQGNLRAGPVRVHPFLGIGELFDDNVFLQPTDTEYDFITVISPGVLFNLPVRRHEISLGYRADILEYARFTEQSNVRHTGQFNAAGKLPGGLSWVVDDLVQRTNERPNDQFDPFIERTQNDGGVSFEYAFADRWAAGADYLNVYYDYENLPPLPDGTLQNYGTELNRIEQYASFDLYYLVQPKTALLVEYTYNPISYFNDATAAARNNSSHLGRAGVRGRITSKVTTQAKMGYQAKSFDNPAQRGFDGFVADVAVAYQPTDWTQLTFLFERDPQEASFIAQGDDFYLNTVFTVTAEHVFNYKLRAFASGAFGNADYGRSSRNDDLYYASAGLRYQIRTWLGVSAEYLYERRDSGGTPGYDFDYTDNRVFVRALVGL